MPKVSMTTASTRLSVPGLMEACQQELAGYSIEIERWDVDMDFAFISKGLPNDQCQASHVGYVLKGKVTLRMADGSEEVFEAGDAMVLKPGHTASVAAGAEWVMFTPIEEHNAMAPVIEANVASYMQEHGIELQG